MCAIPGRDAGPVRELRKHGGPSASLRQLIELYLDLGCPNAAQKNAYELLDNEGATVPVLGEAIVRIHLVKGEYESARVAFGVLQGQAFRALCHRWRDAIADIAR